MRRPALRRIGAAIAAGSAAIVLCCMTVAWANAGAVRPDLESSSPSSTSPTVSPSKPETPNLEESEPSNPAPKNGASGQSFSWPTFLTGLLTGSVAAAVITGFATSRNEAVKYRRETRTTASKGAQTAIDDLKTAVVEFVAIRMAQPNYSPSELVDAVTEVLSKHAVLRARLAEAGSQLDAEADLEPPMTEVTQSMATVLTIAQQTSVDPNSMAGALADAQTKADLLVAALDALRVARAGKK